MLVVSGMALALLTWAACIAACTLVGLPLAAITTSGPLTVPDARRGLWWGLLVITVCAYLINLVLPLASAGAAAVVLLVVGLGALLTGVLTRRRGWHVTWTWTRPTAVIAIVAMASAVYFAVAVLGPVTNYDSGLYHLGALHYAAQYPTIPGLANLYFPLGYANAEFPLAALLEGTPWAGEGFRLLNGLLIVMVLVDLVLRWSQRSRNAGAYVLLVSVTALLVPMLALSDYWVTSPSQDSAVFAVTLVASALLADACSRSRQWVANAAAAAVASVLLVLMRPTMVAYAAAAVAVIVLLRWRRGGAASPRWWPSAIAVGSVTAVAGVAGAARDAVLSGWLMYPLSVLPLDVPWRASDPVYERLATLGFHRDPETLWDAARSWAWIGPWFGRLPHQWETWLLLTLLVACVATLACAVRIVRPIRGRGLLAAMLPSVIMTLVWWALTPPSFRFAWGPVVTCLSIPTGWALWRLTDRHGKSARVWQVLATACFTIPVILVIGFSGATRLSLSSITSEASWRLGLAIPYAVADVRLPATRSQQLASSLVIQVPVPGEQCWSAYPLCSPQAPPTLRPRGASIAAGFLP